MSRIWYFSMIQKHHASVAAKRLVHFGEMKLIKSFVSSEWCHFWWIRNHSISWCKQWVHGKRMICYDFTLIIKLSFLNLIIFLFHQPDGVLLYTTQKMSFHSFVEWSFFYWNFVWKQKTTNWKNLLLAAWKYLI